MNSKNVKPPSPESAAAKASLKRAAEIDRHRRGQTNVRSTQRSKSVDLSKVAFVEKWFCNKVAESLGLDKRELERDLEAIIDQVKKL